MGKAKLDERFDALLKAMSDGDAPSAGKKASARQASSRERDADCREIQTPQDTSKDDSLTSAWS